MKGKVTISDVAQQSGVSVSTVSLVLNDKPGVSQETRSRVLDVAARLGYQVKSSSEKEKSNGLTTIGMVIKTDPDIQPHANPFYSRVIVGIEDACRRKGINLLFATLPVDDNNRPVDVPQILYNEIVDGLLMVGTCVDETFTSVIGLRKIPIVLVDGYSDTDSFDSVVSDNFRAAYQAVEYLIQKGHRHIGLAGSNDNCFPSLQNRRNGYLRAMKENGITETYITDFNVNKSKGYQEIIDFLKAYPHITGLFCVNDDVGSAAIRAAQYLGNRVPEDISIIGFDDTYIAANTHPPLTTMHVDTIAMGRSAVHLLSLRSENPDAACMTLTIHAWLVERESVSTPNPFTRK